MQVLNQMIIVFESFKAFQNKHWLNWTKGFLLHIKCNCDAGMLCRSAGSSTFKVKFYKPEINQFSLTLAMFNYFCTRQPSGWLINN